MVSSPGAFLASGDSSMFLVTQDRIAANFHSITYAPLILASFNLGHSIALPVVSTSTYLSRLSNIDER